MYLFSTHQNYALICFGLPHKILIKYIQICGVDIIKCGKKIKGLSQSTLPTYAFIKLLCLGLPRILSSIHVLCFMQSVCDTPACYNHFTDKSYMSICPKCIPHNLDLLLNLKKSSTWLTRWAPCHENKVPLSAQLGAYSANVVLAGITHLLRR